MDIVSKLESVEIDSSTNENFTKKNSSVALLVYTLLIGQTTSQL